MARLRTHREHFHYFHVGASSGVPSWGAFGKSGDCCALTPENLHGVIKWQPGIGRYKFFHDENHVLTLEQLHEVTSFMDDLSTAWGGQ